jgi:hypothetical protein
MGKFLTDKEIERRLEFEIRYLPIPAPLSTPEGRFITTYKKKPVRMFVDIWEIYDILTDERFKIYTENELIAAAVSTSIEIKTDFNTSLHNVVAEFFNSYKETNLPILREIDDLARELEELEKDEDKD